LKRKYDAEAQVTSELNLKITATMHENVEIRRRAEEESQAFDRQRNEMVQYTVLKPYRDCSSLFTT